MTIIKSKFTYYLVAILIVIDILAFLYSVVDILNHNASYKLIWVPIVIGIMIAGLALYAHTGFNSKTYSQNFKHKALIIGRVSILASLLLILTIGIVFLYISSMNVPW
jgi:uncharacterized membrane-anchored protein